ncbi:MAG: transglycosylase SLT domain-containing protein [Microbacterium sp.]
MILERKDASALPVTRGASSRSGRVRRRASGVLAGLAVVGFAAAIVAPTGIALADPPAQAAAESMYSVALGDTQDLTVTVDGAEISPVERGTFSVYVTPTPTPTATGSTASSAGSLPAYTGGGAPADWMAAAGIAESDWKYVDYIVSRESGWNPNATNASSGACGLVQALPCSKVPGNGYNPVDNLKWGNGYAVGRYGSWAGAYAFWTNNHWW